MRKHHCSISRYQVHNKTISQPINVTYNVNFEQKHNVRLQKVINWHLKCTVRNQKDNAKIMPSHAQSNYMEPH